ncbi:MAG: bifunctional nicotinamide-nucleotide adenylyltransferase/Nudix hydroxylase [Thiothrix sp.]|nr:bifunctional nicotinamide-nucleotide adenylyltransferase/Nudix hydroxylase [Thiothrix sp.]HPQ94542.1 bifunctional nicotinamide-nucleotide adenylyltransferase/Nudix hydroxylase [Thiolinea sp.]
MHQQEQRTTRDVLDTEAPLDREQADGASRGFDFLVFIGRFQPFHNGHLQVLLYALERAERVIVLIGSSHQPRSIRNPWLYTERKQFILAACPPDARERVMVRPLPDALYNDRNWIRRVQETVDGVVHQYPPRTGVTAPAVGLVGHGKDHSSYYLALFPPWGAVDAPAYRSVSATTLREQYFLRGEISAEFPAGVQQALQRFQADEAFHELAEEWRFIRNDQQTWAATPYPPVFVTVDAVVIRSGHVLLVERRTRPGKGLWALPGGFVGPEESLLTAMLRELREETRLKVPLPVLQDAIVCSQVFDHPQRSERGRIITHAWLIGLKPDAGGLPKVRGGDDAARAFWLPLAALDPEQLFEDHFHIIRTLAG